MSAEDVAKVRDGLGAVIDLDGGPGENRAGRLVAAYLGEDGRGFAGRYFDSLGENPPDAFVPADLLALGLLDVPATWPVIVEVLAEPTARSFDGLLAEIPADVDLWDATDDQFEAATALWSRIRKIQNMGWVRSHKLLARKRPRLHPVYDNVVRTWFQNPVGVRYQLREVLSEKPFREELDRRLRPEGNDGLSLIRLIDIAVWMLGSRSSGATAARDRIGVSPPPGRTP